MGHGLPKPCMGDCKFVVKVSGKDRCRTCGMTKKQKDKSKKLDSTKAADKFLRKLVAQHKESGKFSGWLPAYKKKCARKGIDWPH